MLTIRRILFPTDLSEGAQRAFPEAASLADWHDADLHVVNVSQRGEEEKDSFPVPLETLAEWANVSGDTGARPLDVENLTVVQERLEGAVPAESILAYAEDEEMDLIVMGTHGRRGVRRMLLGSVTEEVVRKAPCPVFTVRSEADSTPQRRVRRVLVPVDFSEGSEVAIMHAKEIAQTYGAEIDLLHVIEETVYPSAYGIEPTYFPSQDVLDRVEKRLGAIAREEIGYEHVTVSATVGYAPTMILDYVEERDVDLVVIATHGRTGLDRMLMGSVAERVIRQAPTPVFVVKPERRLLVPPRNADTAADQK